MQDEVRIKLNEYIEQNGIKAKYISELLDIPDYVLSRFRSGKIELNESSLNRLIEYLNKMGLLEVK